MYKKMYYHLFNAVTQALDASDAEKMRDILKNGQIETEEMFISYEPDTVKLFE